MNASIKELDIAYHRTAAAKYDFAVTRHFRFYHLYSLHPWIKRLVKRVPTAIALDVGTGTGVVACDLAMLGCRSVHAIDHSPEMLKVAEERARALELDSKINFTLGNGEELPYDDGSFDAVTIQGVLHHLQDPQPILHEAIRVLSANGELYISEPCTEGTKISRFVNGITGSIGKWLPHSHVEPPSEHEKPIKGPALVHALTLMGMKVEVEYLADLGFVRFLPEWVRIYPVLTASLPTRHIKGDLIFLVGRKPYSSRATPQGCRIT